MRTWGAYWMRMGGAGLLCCARKLHTLRIVSVCARAPSRPRIYIDACVPNARSPAEVESDYGQRTAGIARELLAGDARQAPMAIRDGCNRPNRTPQAVPAGCRHEPHGSGSGAEHTLRAAASQWHRLRWRGRCTARCTWKRHIGFHWCPFDNQRPTDTYWWSVHSRCQRRVA